MFHYMCFTRSPDFPAVKAGGNIDRKHKFVHPNRLMCGKSIGLNAREFAGSEASGQLSQERCLADLVH